MDFLSIIVPVFLAGAGVLVMVVGFAGAKPAGDVGRYLQDLDEDVRFSNDFDKKLAEPFIVRLTKPLGGLVGRVGRLTPRNYLDQIHRKLLLSGLTGTMRAEEFVVAQLASTGLLTMAALLYAALGHPSGRVSLLLIILAPLTGILLPTAWLSRKVGERQGAILKDLPDTLDLLAISVEAGMGFEGALAIVCQHFSSPLAEEFARTLHEMELGLPRRDAFQNLKRRTEVPELSNFVLALLQADALGIPIGRVLKTQATEMRNKRRQWAREKAAKLPVKMLFPLVLFVFPSIMVVILGPAAAGISQAFK
ncbi:MAG: tight adherence protein [Actinomycetota bacterium]|jgi:tight adherence protein C|nr:tight adherence protein [Actinomycetota bacterium]MEA2844459.1 tight adherence protein [Actinomycetota bacterium]